MPDGMTAARGATAGRGPTAGAGAAVIRCAGAAAGALPVTGAAAVDVAAGAAGAGGAGAAAAGVGILIVGAAVGLGGKLIRTVSFFGCTLAASAGFGGTAPVGVLGIFSAIKLSAFNLGLALGGVKSLIPKKSPSIYRPAWQEKVSGSRR